MSTETNDSRRALAADERREAIDAYLSEHPEAGAAMTTPEPSDELARLLPDLPHRIAYARQAAKDDEPLDVAVRELARACELLLAERDQWSAYARTADLMLDKGEEAHARTGALAAEMDREIVALRARVAELEARQLEAAGDPKDLTARDIADAIRGCAVHCAEVLRAQGWEGDGARYSIERRHVDVGDLRALLSRDPTPTERVQLEQAIRAELDKGAK